MSDEGTTGPDDDLGALYDEGTLAAITGAGQATPTTSRAGMGGWRHTSGAGAIAAASVLGLGEALEGRPTTRPPPIVADDPGQPLDPSALVEVDFDPDSPIATRARLRGSSSR